MNHRDYLMRGAMYQDMLLQFYRMGRLVVALTCTVAAATVSVLYVQLHVVSERSPLWVVFHGAFLILFALSDRYFGGVIEARARDVDYWHRRLVMCEVYGDKAGHTRYFTHFKVWQQHRDSGPIPGESDKLLRAQVVPTDGDLDRLLGKDKGHVRKLIDSRLYGVMSVINYVSFALWVVTYFDMI